LDLIYLQPGGETMEYLIELRLQNLENLNLNTLGTLSERFDTPKMRRAIENITHLIQSDSQQYEGL